MGARFIGWGVAVPDRVVTNDELSLTLDTTDEWIAERTGIRERRIGGTTSSLGVLAGRRALVRARMVDDGDVLVIGPQGLRRLIQEDPEVSEVLMRAFILRRVALIEAGGVGSILVGNAGSGALVHLQGFLARNGYPHTVLDISANLGGSTTAGVADNGNLTAASLSATANGTATASATTKFVGVSLAGGSGSTANAMLTQTTTASIGKTLTRRSALTLPPISLPHPTPDGGDPGGGGPDPTGGCGCVVAIHSR